MLEIILYYICHSLCLYRLMVRTSDFQSGYIGSSPVRDAIIIKLIGRRNECCLLYLVYIRNYFYN